MIVDVRYWRVRAETLSVNNGNAFSTCQDSDSVRIRPNSLNSVRPVSKTWSVFVTSMFDQCVVFLGVFGSYLLPLQATMKLTSWFIKHSMQLAGDEDINKEEAKRVFILLSVRGSNTFKNRKTSWLFIYKWILNSSFVGYQILSIIAPKDVKT